jgi:hypothetical protein
MKGQLAVKQGTDNNAAQGRALAAVILGCAALLLSLAPEAALAQTTGQATLVGTITDSSGAIVPGAKVSVVNPQTSFLSESESNSQGDYYVPYLNPGLYGLTIKASGFKLYVRDGIAIRAGESPRVDVALEVGSASEQITVSGAAPLLATETSVASQIIDRALLTELPVPAKKVGRLLFYFPGAVNSVIVDSLAGQRLRSISYTLDGISGKVPAIGTAFGSQDSINPGLEAVEQVKVSTTGITAETGRAGGGEVALVFRSGTNQLHGSIGDTYLSTSMIHRHYLQQDRSTAPYTYHEVLASASGPLYLPKVYNGKDRTFWLFGLAVQREQSVETAAMLTVPSAEMLDGNFSFGGQGLPIYNPFTTRQDASGRWIRDPFPGNTIPKNLIDPVVQEFFSYKPFREPNRPGIMTRTGPTQNLIMERPKTIPRTRWDIKIDHQFSPNHKIFGRYSHGHNRVSGPTSGTIQWNVMDAGLTPNPADQINGVLSDTLVLDPRRFNEIRLGYHRHAASTAPVSYGQDWAGKLGIPNTSPLTFPMFNIGFGIGSLSRTRQVGEAMTFQDNFTQIIGSHTLKVGYELIRTRYSAVLPDLPAGTYNFAGTEHPFTPNTGNTFASFLLGTVGSGVYTQNFASWLPRWWQHSWYVQDDWKPVRGLTLTLGLRWAYESPFQTKYGQQAQFDPAAADPLTGRMGAILHPKGELARRDWNNFQPRLGMAWSLRPRVVFRSSFGISALDLMTTGVGQNFQEYQGTINVQAPPGDPRHSFRLSEGPGRLNYPVAPDGSVPYVGTNYSARVAHWNDPNMRIPYVMNWSGGFQYQFKNNWLAELMYQGTAGVKLLNSWNMNAIPLNISTEPAVLNQIFQASQDFKPYPQFGTINLYSNFGHNTYHSGTLRVEKRYSMGLTLLSFYTFSKALDDTDGEGVATGVSYYNRRLEKGRAGYDRRHNFTSMLNYELPIGKNRRFLNRGGWLNHAVGGWEISWVQAFQSGRPASVTFAGSPYKYLPQEVYRPNTLVPMEQAVVKDWSMGPHRFPSSAQNPYLRFDAFTYPAPFTVGTLGRNTFEAAGVAFTQLALFKNWKVGERATFTLRVEGNNLPFKHPQFNPPISVYNANSPSTFGRYTGVFGGATNFGASQPNIWIVVRAEF